MILSKMEYLKALHDLAYTANMADAVEHKQDWQHGRHISDHVNPVLAIVKDVLSEDGRLYDIFMDCFGDFGSFAEYAEKYGSHD